MALLEIRNLHATVDDKPILKGLNLTIDRAKLESLVSPIIDRCREPIIRAVVEDIWAGCSTGLISATFHNTMVALFVEVCQRLRESRGLKEVVLSGGCFQNARLLTALPDALESQGFEVHTQAQVPSNDGGIALGQALVADAVYKARYRGRP